MRNKSSILAQRKVGTPIRDLDGNERILLTEMKVEENHSGPIPSYKQMLGYKKIDPDLPSRIMADAEKNSEHIRNKEILQISEHYKDKNKGRIAGIIAVVSAFFLSGFALFTGYPEVAAFIGGTVVIGLATIFVLNQKHMSKD